MYEMQCNDRHSTLARFRVCYRQCPAIYKLTNDLKGKQRHNTNVKRSLQLSPYKSGHHHIFLANRLVKNPHGT